MATAECVKEVLFLKAVVEELGQKPAGLITILCDNQSAIIQSKQTYCCKVPPRSQVTRGESNQCDVHQHQGRKADIFTKALAKADFERMRKKSL